MAKEKTEKIKNEPSRKSKLKLKKDAEPLKPINSLEKSKDSNNLKEESKENIVDKDKELIDIKELKISDSLEIADEIDGTEIIVKKPRGELNRFQTAVKPL